jgi:serine/threonine-protein kinase RsbW
VPRIRSWQVTVPARPESIEAIHELVMALREDQPQLPDRDMLRLETAVIETAENIVEHATAGRTGVREVSIDVTLTATHDRIAACLRDDGSAATIDLAGAQMPDEMAEAGRGLALMRALTDEVSYERSGLANIWTLTCLRSDREGAAG